MMLRHRENNVHSICILPGVTSFHQRHFPRRYVERVVLFKRFVCNFHFSLTEDIRKQLNTKKDVWVNLPKQMCDNHRFASQDNTASCWNGVELQR